MPQLVQIKLAPYLAFDDSAVNESVVRELRISQSKNIACIVRKRSLDARKRPIQYLLTVEVYIDEKIPQNDAYFVPQFVGNAHQVAIVGAGPAGLFAALRAIEKGLKPIVFERGKNVQERRRDLAKINKEHLVNPESNYCFGEGGAGTYSDGKLYTRSKKRGSVEQVLNWLISFGADKEIAVSAHPHIGTNQLPKIIEKIRQTIIEYGGEVHFGSKLTDIFIEHNKLVGIEINHKEKHSFDELILATGHSARDIYYLLHQKNIELRAKPFAIGVRVEHPQALINAIQYHGDAHPEYLPPASYALVEQVDGMGVYSFCMCPGGIIAPCATDQNEVVTNGWSPSKRNNPYANSGVVVQIQPEDLPGDLSDPLIGLKFQMEVEQKCCSAAGNTQKVPAQRMIDFVENRVSKDLPKTSYIPGLASLDLTDVLPPLIAKRLQKAFVLFGKKMKGYYTNDAVLHAPESRTSSPVQIPRDKETLQHVSVKGFYPCAEGAGYAGGIVSAAIDGINCMDKILNLYGKI